jgi:diguanylate cyclase (GGDEF)-like protein
MPTGLDPTRSPGFRLFVLTAAGFGTFLLALGALNGFGLDDSVTGLPAIVIGTVIALLCSVAASSSVASFFAGVDESVGYMHNELQRDKLTGHLSRLAMKAGITDAAAEAIRTGEPTFLIDIDIDRFKQINETIGYALGDDLIREFSARLKSVLPRGVHIGRIGAGEFAVLIPDRVADERLGELLDRLIDHAIQPYPLKTHLQSISLSVGVAAIPKDGTDPAVLLRRSNLAVQDARQNGIGQWAVFETEMGKVAEQRQWVESELQTAFQRGDFLLYYQPQHDLSDGRIIGYEALIRWKHPIRGMIPPAEFIPIAEQTGIIGQIGEWVLRQACADALHLPADCSVAVNISPVQFLTRDFLDVVADSLRASGLDPRRLELEITESAMMQNREQAGHLLRRLDEMGISVAVDDFGTGYSNLGYLIDFPFHKMKIDQSFVLRMEEDSKSAAVVSTVIGLARALGVRSIAEGVETENQALLLRAAGCNEVQGYLYGRPAPLGTKPVLRLVKSGDQRVA